MAFHFSSGMSLSGASGAVSVVGTGVALPWSWEAMAGDGRRRRDCGRMQRSAKARRSDAMRRDGDLRGQRGADGAEGWRTRRGPAVKSPFRCSLKAGIAELYPESPRKKVRSSRRAHPAQPATSCSTTIALYAPPAWAFSFDHRNRFATPPSCLSTTFCTSPPWAMPSVSASAKCQALYSPRPGL